MNKPRAKIIPKSPKVGDVVEVKTLITHVMETGLRKNRDGTLVPRHIIHTLTATYNGTQVFRGALNTGISANPYISFRMRVTGPGVVVLKWIEDGGKTATLEVPVEVS